MLRRRTGSAPAVVESDPSAMPPGQGAKQAGKGRPTPKRSEVERRRRQPYTPPPTDRKAAAAQQRDHRRAEQKRKMDAMRRGEEWAIPPRDRGQVKALARDYIDSRRLLASEYILFAVFAIIFLVLATGAVRNSTIVLYVELAILVVIALEASYHGARVTRIARQRFPGQSTRGITWYVAKRSIRLRGSRIPPARVKRGEAF